VDRQALLVVLNLPMIGLWEAPSGPLSAPVPAIMAFSQSASTAVNNSSFEIYLTALFGVIGFVWIRPSLQSRADAARLCPWPDDEEHLRRAC